MTSGLADRWTVYDRLIQYSRYKKVVPFIPRGSVLADCGCGNGDFLRYIRERIFRGYGVDRSVKNLSLGSNCSFLEGDLNQRIPLANDTVDAVTALALLEHLNCPEVFIKEVCRVLKPGGSCILTTPSPRAKALLEFLAYKAKIISEKDIRDHKKYFDKEDLKHLFSKFSEVSISYFLFGLNTLIVAER